MFTSPGGATQPLGRPSSRPLFTQPDVTTSTHPGHYLGREKLSRRPSSLWIAAGLPTWRTRSCIATRKSIEHEMCDDGQR